MSDVQPKLADRLRGVRVALRADLEITRHVFRGRACYVVRDPLSFQSHRFDLHDYQVLIALNDTRTLGDIFQDLVLRGIAAAAQEEQFYQFIYSLHRHAFLQLPVSDDKVLYRRHQAGREMRRRRLWSALLSYQVPLWNPDAFLDRTAHWVRFAFTRTFFLIWLMLMAAAGWVAFRQSDSLIQPLNGILAASNLPIMWATLVVLKTIHEFGHAFACKIAGVRVPEMGLNFIVGTPCAYVDASGSWQLSSKMQRIAICLAGMYFESIIAAIAVFAWAAADEGLLKSVAFNVIFLASTITVLFNINPLMRFDGYYIASDLLETPNLRQRSSQALTDFIKQLFLGVKPRTAAATAESYLFRTVLLGFGVASGAYRVIVTIGIVVILAMKLSLIGVVLGALFAIAALARVLAAVVHYLFAGEETRPVRMRAAALGVCLVVGIPTLCALAPMPNRVAAGGVVRAEHESILRAGASGFVDQIFVRTGQRVHESETCFNLENAALRESLVEAETQRDAALIRSEAKLASDLVRSRQEAEKSRLWQAEVENRSRLVRELAPIAAARGTVVESLGPRDLGRFVQVGTPLMTVVDGPPTVRVLVDEKQIGGCAPQLGDAVVFRPAASPHIDIPGVVSRITPAGSNQIEYAALTHDGGGAIVVNPADSKALQRYFEIWIRLEQVDAPLPPRGSTGSVLFTGPSESLGRLALRRFVGFLDQVLRS